MRTGINQLRRLVGVQVKELKTKDISTLRVLWAFSMAPLIIGLTSVLGSPASASADEVFVTNFAKNGNIQTNLQSSFPGELFTPANSLGARFDITSDNEGNNFAQLFGGPDSNQIFAPGTFTVAVGTFGATDVFTLMNAYSPEGGTLTTVEFFGSAGATQIFSLVDGVDVRDFYHGSYANSINGTTTQNAFTVENVVGGGRTGNSSDGLFGTYVIDEQMFALNSAFASQTLTRIVYAYSGSAGTPIVEGVTVRTASVPEPATVTMLLAGCMFLLAATMTRRLTPKLRKPFSQR